MLLLTQFPPLYRYYLGVKKRWNCPCWRHEAYGGSGLSRTGSYARHEMELNSVPHPRPLYLRGMSLQCSLSRRRLGLQSPSGRFGEQKIYWCLDTNSVSSSPHLSHYVNWAIPAATCTSWGLHIFTSVIPNIIRLCSLMLRTELHTHKKWLGNQPPVVYGNVAVNSCRTYAGARTL